MTYKSILAVLTGTGTDTATMSVVDQIAGKFDAHVDVFHVRSDPMSYVSYTGDAMSIDVYSRIIEAAEEENAARSEVARKAFDAWVEQKNIPMLDTPDGLDHVTASWREQTGNEADLVAGAGRVYDLVILGPGSDETGAAHDTAIEKAIFDTGRPALLGTAEPVDGIGKRIDILWNGSAEAARAVDAALPLLSRADQVHILSVNEDTGPEPAQTGLTRYLSWHGITATLATFEPDERLIGEALLTEVRRNEADLLVMGAYGHSRLRELVLGGVTRHMLKEDHPPIFAAH
ncbi:MAG: universal stress protein [Alphaproteobacteria bacterium]|nr:universal stress protein [Alphaproteobacteria bacterium]